MVTYSSVADGWEERVPIIIHAKTGSYKWMMARYHRKRTSDGRLADLRPAHHSGSYPVLGDDL